MSQPGFFDFEERLASLSKAGDPFKVWLEPLILRFSVNRWTRRSSIPTARKADAHLTTQL